MIYLNDNIADFDFEAALPLLSEQRREQALKFKYELGRKTCAAAYLLLCEGLRKEYGITEKPLFEYGEHGKPQLVGHPDIHFNMSHCREAAICVLSKHPVGVDVESIREYKDSLARYTMNDKELERIASAERPNVEFTRLWTMKEAVLKCSGVGINNDIKNVLTGEENIETTVNFERSYVYSVVFSALKSK
jgi:4'-phosphopantetheinyl transferase